MRLTVSLRPDEATGRNAVADGEYFKVIGSGDVAAREYRRTNSSVSVLVAEYPSSDMFKIIRPLYDPNNNIDGKYVAKSDGNIKSSAGTVLSILPVKPGRTYVIKSSMWTGTAFVIGFKETNSTADGPTLGNILVEDLVDTSDPQVKKFTVPNNIPANFAFINLILPNISFDISESLEVNEGSEIVKEVLITNIGDAKIIDINANERLSKEFLKNSALRTNHNLYDTSNNVSDKYIQVYSGNVGSSTGTIINVFQVRPGKTYLVKSSSFKTTSFAIAFRETNSTIDGQTLGMAVLDSTDNPQIKKFTVPSNAKFGFVNIIVPGQNFDIFDSLSIKEGEYWSEEKCVFGIGDDHVADFQARSRLDLIEPIIPNPYFSPLKGKSWAVIGDSITHKNYRSNLNYHDYVSEMVEGMTIFNYGLSGTGFFNRFSAYENITQSPDIITVLLGTNDWNNNGSNNKQLGNLTDTGTDTISGCISTLMLGLLTKFPTKIIAMMTPIPRIASWGSNATSNSQGYTLEDLANRICELSRHYSVPCLDLYHESNLPVYIPAGNAYYFTAPGHASPDGLHPNDEGQKVMANKIKSFLEAL